MTKFIFEDNPNTTVSYLFLQCYNSKNLIFSNGNGEITKKLDDCYTEEDNFIIFLDFNCRNRLYTLFMDVKRYIHKKYNNPSNVIVVPIPCIEYIVIKMLSMYGYVVNNSIQKVLSFDKVFIKSIEGTGFEGKMKGYLSSLGDDYKNYNLRPNGEPYDVIKDNLGNFYLQSDGKPSLKAERLYTTLPVFDNLKEIDSSYIDILKTFNIITKDLTIDELERFIKDFFDDMSTKLGRDKYKLSIKCK